MDDHPAATLDRPTVNIRDTPMLRIYLNIDSSWRPVRIKLEGHNPGGSLKDRTAAYLIADLEARQLIRRSSVIIESTSGNLGVGLASLCRGKGYPFLAIIDPKTTPEIRCRMRDLGAALDFVDTPDHTGGYLLSRLERVNQLLKRSSQYVWTDQYGNPANPRAHYLSTGPELYRQAGPNVDAIFVAVSTGGTLAGVGKYFREASPATKIIAVDAVGSVVFTDHSAPRKLTGIGSSRKSTFITRSIYDAYMLISDQEAFAMCRQAARVGLRLGGSSGALLAACATYLHEDRVAKNVVCLCPDGSESYKTTIFDDDWMSSNGFRDTCNIGLRFDVLSA